MTSPTPLGTIPEWHEHANCAGLGDAMFPEKNDPAASARAKRICANCNVRTECLNDALTRTDEWGVRGGMTGIERRALRRAAKQQQEVAAA